MPELPGAKAWINREVTKEQLVGGKSSTDSLLVRQLPHV